MFVTTIFQMEKLQLLVPLVKMSCIYYAAKIVAEDFWFVTLAILQL